MIRTIFMCAVLSGAVCQAEPYWVRYDAASGLYPEEAGWTREVSDPAPERWIEDDLLSIDSRAGFGMEDIYRMYSDGTQDPGPGETFVARWRLRADYVDFCDPGVVVVSDDQYEMDVVYGYDRLWTFPFVGFVPFEPGIFHTYELRSSDMRQFSFFVDGVLTVQAPLAASLPPAKVCWGDMTAGSSLAEWDYFEFGVIPEPSGALCVLAIGAALGAWRGSSRFLCGRRTS